MTMAQAEPTTHATRQQPLISIVLPVYNEAENIQPCLRRLWEALREHPHEILVCYDFDGDTTLPAIAAMEDRPPTVRLVKNDLGRGAAYAMQAGFDAARGDVVVTTMADLSDPPGRIPEMAGRVRQGASVVSGSRYMKGGAQHGGPLLKRTLSRMAGLSLHYLSGVGTHDATTNFRAYSTEFLRSVRVQSRSGFELALELTVKAHLAGRQVDEVPSTWHDRSAGQSRFQLWKWMPRYLNWYLRAMAAPLLVWGVWLVLAVWIGSVIWRDAPDMPFWDEVHQLPFLTGHWEITAGWLWSAHNEHRIVVPRILYLLTVGGAGNDFRAGMWLNLAMMATAAALLVLATRRWRGRTVWLDVFFPVALLNFGHFENMLSSFQIAFTIYTLLVAALLYLLVRTRRVVGAGQAVVLGLIVLLMQLSGGTGVILAPVLIAWMVWQGVQQRRANEDRRAALVLLCMAGLAVLVQVVYFIGYQSPAHHRAPVTAEAVGLGVLRVLAVGFGTGARDWMMWYGIVAAVVVGAAGLLLVHRWRTIPRERARCGGLLAVTAALGLLVLSIGWSRGPMGLAFSSRYMALVVPLLAVAFMVMSIHGGRITRYVVPLLLLAGMLVAWPRNLERGMVHAQVRMSVYQSIREQAQLGVPLPSIIASHADWLHELPREAAAALRLMAKHELGPFRDVQYCPAVEVALETTPATAHEMEWTGEEWLGTGDDPFLVFALEAPRAVRAVRVRFRAESLRGEPVTFQLFWADTSRRQRFTGERRNSVVTLRPQAEMELTVIINEPIDTLRIDPHIGPCRFELQELLLLVDPADPDPSPGIRRGD